MTSSDATRDLERQTRRRANLRHLIDLLIGEGFTSAAAQGGILGNLTGEALREILAGAEISDALAREVEWSMSRPEGWLDEKRQSALDD
ncbi:hypothetical protein L2Y96_12585 [Luteibacter aegosomaticola]|uniref:hypothetical protein n=1 Tax=Luteibacter aegosomaticola TaxID=2911538 RepID=UPI001FFA1E2E|nr:hypothetical protein [Luteibacter aegosomaticola]UPG88256.1 hypothetical protein L2Y96_12585 [Luteibacter aegosomaticola]